MLSLGSLVETWYCLGLELLDEAYGPDGLDELRPAED